MHRLTWYGFHYEPEPAAQKVCYVEAKIFYKKSLVRLTPVLPHTVAPAGQSWQHTLGANFRRSACTLKLLSFGAHSTHIRLLACILARVVPLKSSSGKSQIPAALMSPRTSLMTYHTCTVTGMPRYVLAVI
jgi:hypothetical protein